LIKAITPNNIVEYEYDGFGRRIGKKVFDAQHALLNTQHYVYDGDQSKDDSFTP
jgi:YD repeat-containing protein